MHLKINVLNNQGHCCGKRNKAPLFIVIFMLMGILSGAAIHAYATPTTVSAWADNITLLTDLFLRLIKMVIAPLVFNAPDGRHYAPRRDGDHRPGRREGDGLVIVTFQHPGADHLLGIIHSRRAGDRHLPAPGRRVKPGGAERGGGYRPGGQRHEPERSSVALSPPASPRRWPTTRSCRSWCSRCSSASPARRWGRSLMLRWWRPLTWCRTLC